MDDVGLIVIEDVYNLCWAHLWLLNRVLLLLHLGAFRESAILIMNAFFNSESRFLQFLDLKVLIGLVHFLKLDIIIVLYVTHSICNLYIKDLFCICSREG